MKALQIYDVKRFMGKMFGESFFDQMFVTEFIVTTAMRVTYDGKRNAGWFDEVEKAELMENEMWDYICWKEMKPHVFSLIRGTKTPENMKGVFLLPANLVKKVLEEAGALEQKEWIQSLVLNLQFDGNDLKLITGCSLKTFTMDKTVEYAWDAYVQKLLRDNQIAYEEV